MQNLEAIWKALDELAADVICVDRSVGMQMLQKNKELMLTYQQLSTQIAQLTTSKNNTSASNGKPKEAAAKAP